MKTLIILGLLLMCECHNPAYTPVAEEPKAENLCSGPVMPDLRHTGMFYIPNGCAFVCGEESVVVEEGGIFFSYSLLNKMVEEERQKQFTREGK